MQQSVRKLFPENICLQVVFNALLNDGHVEDAVYAWALTRILLQAHLHDVFKRKGVGFGQGWILLLTDLHT